jgi:predicted nucleic acid-binding protein
MFVIYASVVSNWCLPEESHPYAVAAKARLAEEDAVTSAIFWFELRNVLLVAERRGRITEAQTTALLSSIGALPINEDHDQDERVLFSLARTYRLSIYDAAYLELAKREGFALASLDKALLVAAKAEKVSLVGEPEANIST